MLLLLLLAFTVQLLIWLFVFYPALSPGSTPGQQDRPVSVIVCFRDEARRIEACLRGLLAQRHSDFEVIAVDDNSSDESAAIVQRICGEARHLRLVRPGPTRPGKKDALSAGIAAASHPRLLLTDADCVPASTDWLSRMAAPLDDGAETVLGCSPYRRAPGWLNRWQRFESTQTVLQYQGLARLGMPYMGVGRNLAYSADFFSRAGGLEGHAHVPGGDDDLLVNGNAVATRTARVTRPEAWTLSESSPDWESYFFQKTRHQSVGLHYRRRHQLLLIAIAASHGLFYLSGLLLLLTPLAPYALMLYAVRAVVVVATYVRSPVSRFLGGGAGAVAWWKVPGLLVADSLYSFYYLFLLLASFSDRRSW
ncbi:glycosyltransferase [Neolewinella litorea]|uniref:Glycosyltransferase n=1 Tax=Neolewinella litorea TaxID=2562452 RepID=A0A4S4NHJ1_9BACT|nr:glycosyltransferase [Neolewinella litorea]THH37671.1 glycosyltransferase [Neolewinella litorea]